MPPLLVDYEKEINFKIQIQQFAFCTAWSLKNVNIQQCISYYPS